MPDAATPLVFPALGAVYAALAPWAELLLRAFAGLALVPHGLRMCFGFFPKSGSPVNKFSMLAQVLAAKGYRPGRFWAWVVALTEFIAGPLLALGLFTRPAAFAAFILMALSVWDHGRNDGYFWNTLGLEYPLMWTLAILYFVINGGGVYSVDHLILGWGF